MVAGVSGPFFFQFIYSLDIEMGEWVEQGR